MKMLRCIPTCLSALLLFALTSPAQIPGQYPGQYPGQPPGQYPPGQYPPGQYPPGTRSPIPRIPGQTGPIGGRRSGQPQPESRGKRSNSEAQLLTTTTGILRRVAPNQLVIQPDDHRVVWYRLAPQLMVRKDGKDADLKDFALGDYLSVDSNSDDDSIMTAVSVTWQKAATPDDRAEASKTWDLPRLETVARGSAKSLRLVPTRRLPRRRGSPAMIAPSFAARRSRACSCAPSGTVPDKPKETASGQRLSKAGRTGQHTAADANASARSQAGC